MIVNTAVVLFLADKNHNWFSKIPIDLQTPIVVLVHAF